ncbi:MAG: hypothetical protein WDN28_00115 [Chthoniobacter sp.]
MKSAKVCVAQQFHQQMDVVRDPTHRFAPSTKSFDSSAEVLM